jgi:hypothetical protein
MGRFMLGDWFAVQVHWLTETCQSSPSEATCNIDTQVHSESISIPTEKKIDPKFGFVHRHVQTGEIR